MAEKREQQGTGKHPHKDTQEPWPHHETKEQRQESEQRGKDESSRQQADTSDLKEREYRDEQGNIHHHTRTYEEQHKKK
jgi:hypothetical protein